MSAGPLLAGARPLGTASARWYSRPPILPSWWRRRWSSSHGYRHPCGAAGRTTQRHGGQAAQAYRHGSGRSAGVPRQGAAVAHARSRIQVRGYGGRRHWRRRQGTTAQGAAARLALRLRVARSDGGAGNGRRRIRRRPARHRPRHREGLREVQQRGGYGLAPAAVTPRQVKSGQAVDWIGKALEIRS